MESVHQGLYSILFERLSTSCYAVADTGRYEGRESGRRGLEGLRWRTGVETLTIWTHVKMRGDRTRIHLWVTPSSCNGHGGDRVVLPFDDGDHESIEQLYSTSTSGDVFLFW